MIATSGRSMILLFLLFAACFAEFIIHDGVQIVMSKTVNNPTVVSTYKRPFLHWSMLDDPTCPECTSPSPGVYCPCNTPGARNMTHPWPWGPPPPPPPPCPLNVTVSVNGSRTVLARDDASVKTDATRQFYAHRISGQDPHTIPIVVEQRATPSDGRETEPVVLLGYANTTVLSSFISLPLVKALGLFDTIRSDDSLTEYYVTERDVSALLGYETSSARLVTIRLLAGKNDKAREVDFRVIQAPSAKDTAGIWYPDVILGLNLLNSLNALQLSPEFTGSDETGAKEGLGILVQTMVEGGRETKPEGHDEL